MPALRLQPLILLFIVPVFCFAQSKDTLRKYLNENLEFTTRFNMVYGAIALRSLNKWTLIAYYPNTRILVKASFKDRKLTIKDGIFTLNYSNGFKALEGTFVNNQRDGNWQSWYMNGHLRDSGLIINNAMSGTWVYGYENGKTRIRAAFKEKIIIYRKTVNSTKSLLDFPDLMSVKHGRFQSWHENGSPKDSGAYHENQKAGYWKLWYENGNVESAGYFTNDDTLHGDWIFYREDGSPSTKEKYHYNKLISLVCFSEKGDSTGSLCSVATPPFYLGSPFDWKEYLDRNIEWSKETLRKYNYGILSIRLTIGKDGTIARYTIDNSPGDLVTKDIDRIIKRMTNWSPAILHNRPYEYTLEHSVTLNFR